VELLRPPYPIVTAPACADPADLLDCCSPLSLGCQFPGIRKDLLVFAAASLGRYLQKVFKRWKQTPVTGAVRFYNARQFWPAGAAIPAGRHRADVFIAASGRVENGRTGNTGELRPGSRRDLLGNSLVLIAHGQRQPAGHAGAGKWDSCPLLPGEAAPVWAMVETRCPAGIYGKAALTSPGVCWPGKYSACRPVRQCGASKR